VTASGHKAGKLPETEGLVITEINNGKKYTLFEIVSQIQPAFMEAGEKHRHGHNPHRILLCFVKVSGPADRIKKYEKNLFMLYLNQAFHRRSGALRPCVAGRDHNSPERRV
jgi:hypothetical protein